MNRPGAKQHHRTYGASTIGADLSIKYPHGFTHMSISPYGRDVVLAGRAGLAIVDLEFPLSPPRTIPISSRSKIAGVAWCPNTQHHGWVATPVSQTLLVHDLAHTTTEPMLVIKAHPTTITDVAWVPKIPSWIGTASIDPIIKIWDARRDQKPVWYFSEWEPTDLLAFNNVHMHKMASVHRNKIAIWDIRYGSGPLTTISDAHTEDIVSISWHPDSEDELVSAGQDRTVKRWNVRYASQTEDYSHTFAHDIISADYLPFGDGILVKQRSPDNEVVVVKDSAQLAPVHRLVGHTDTVLASAWRVQGAVSAVDGADARDFQLVTWGQDQVMRMWATSFKLIEAVGGEPSRVARDVHEPMPSFATNFIGPDKILHLIEQRALPSEFLLASAGGLGGAQKITTMHEYDRAGNMREGIRLVSTSETASEAPLSAGDRDPAAAAAARTSTADERSSDDDDDQYVDSTGRRRRRQAAGALADAADWREEVEAVVGSRYRRPKMVTIKDMRPDQRQCRLAVGVPWITRDTLALRVTFPVNYPAFPAQFAVEALGSVYGARAAVAELVGGVADACAAQGVAALDRCLYALLRMLIPKARAKGMARGARSGSIKAEDLERLPPPPAKLPWEAVDEHVAGQAAARSAAALGRRLSRAGQQAGVSLSPLSRAGQQAGVSLSPSAALERSRSRSLRRSGEDAPRWASSSLPSDDNMSGLSRDDDDDDGDGGGLLSGSDYGSSGSSRGSEDDDDDDDDFAMGYGGDNDDHLYYSDLSPAELPVDNDGLPISLRHVSNRERYDAKTPFPRLCGGVFSGAGTLVCFFASIYTPDTYPEPSGLGQQGRAGRERVREDMSHQLGQISKPRNFLKLNHYQGMVQFGLQNKGAYFAYDAPGGGEPVRVDGGGGAGGGLRRRSSSLSGFDESSDGEARDEEVPRFYFRKQISHNALTGSASDRSDSQGAYFRPAAAAQRQAATTGVGNVALVCAVPEDRSAARDLAQQFELAGASTSWVCSHNASVARLNGRRSLAHIWSMLACLLAPVQPAAGGAGGNRVWAAHPSIVRWLRSVMVHYERRGDVQTLALLACVLSMALAEAAAEASPAAASVATAAAAAVADGSPDDADADAGLAAAAADAPPWMAAAAAARTSGYYQPSARPKGRGRVGWDILGSTAAEAVAAAALASQQMRVVGSGDAPGYPPNASVAQLAGQRAVSFMVPTTAAAAAAAAVAVSAVAAADTSAPSVSSAIPAPSPSQTPPPPPVAVGPDALSLAAVESLLGRRLPAGDHAAAAAVALAGGLAAQEPMSPELLRELDSEEIKQNELMMAEGLDDRPTEPTREPTPVSSTPTPTTGAAEPHEDAAAGRHLQRSSSEQPHEQASVEPDGAENLWRRLRSNVLGRVQTAAVAGAKPGSLDMAESPPAVPATSSEPSGGGDAAVSSTAAKGPARQQQQQQRRQAQRRQAWGMSSTWVPLLSGKEGVAAQAAAKEQAYLRTKRAFEQLHTRLVVRDRGEWADDGDVALVLAGDYRMQAAYLDHWKLLYARILYKWRMNTKAIEVLKCVQDPVLREFYNQMYCQPTVPMHDNQPRIANPLARAQALLRADDVHSDCGTESAATDATMEIGGTPWLACAWCHEYVHGLALICHSCGHGGHQEHMQRWFSIVRRQLLQNGPMSLQYERPPGGGSGSSSSTSLARRSAGGVSAAVVEGVSPRAQQSLVAAMNAAGLASASDYLSSFVNSPAAAAPADAAPVPELTITPSAGSISSGSSSSGGSTSTSTTSSSSSSSSFGSDTGSEYGDARDPPDAAYTATATAAAVGSEGPRGWEASDGESDDHLHAPHTGILHLTGSDGLRIRRAYKSHMLTPQDSQTALDGASDDAFVMRVDVPTCPSGCGCNCLYESRRLIM
ncbi:hypothetical protein GGI15_002312 [Coemansia interrupta]|uniref:RWD domain-containing protein n=1 Tax=Coemansia interrupta TaxID=1126814 RepID=A0A9W8HFV5_9FUNG|nr:hypothetical protein GGI15_002312 [Coemansia interrupta]